MYIVRHHLHLFHQFLNTSLPVLMNLKIFLFENGNRRRSKCIGDQSARSSSTRDLELSTVRGRSIDRVSVRASGRVARWFFDSWIFHVIRLVLIDNITFLLCLSMFVLACRSYRTDRAYSPWFLLSLS